MAGMRIHALFNHVYWIENSLHYIHKNVEGHTRAHTHTHTHTHIHTHTHAHTHTRTHIYKQTIDNHFEFYSL